MRLWEIHLIVMGYRKRNKLTNQLLAESVYATIHVMRDPKGKTPEDMFPQLFEDENEDIGNDPPITDEDAADLQALMARMNATNAKKSE